LFRIHSEDDLYAMGYYDYLDNGVIVAEWGQNIPTLEKDYTVTIEKLDENTREIKYESFRT
jgi:tRNA threonylcarbamoyladenosine biosynthesis protein TsaE